MAETIRHLVQREKHTAIAAFSLSGSMTAMVVAPMMDMAMLAAGRMRARRRA